MNPTTPRCVSSRKKTQGFREVGGQAKNSVDASAKLVLAPCTFRVGQQSASERRSRVTPRTIVDSQQLSLELSEQVKAYYQE